MQKVKKKTQVDFADLVSDLREDLDLSHLGGQAEPKRKLLELVEQLRFSSVFKHWDSPPPRGLILVGPPGTGKSHAVRCLANEAGCYLVEIRYEDIASKYVDAPIEYLKNIKESVEKVTEQGNKVIIFLDEADSFMPSRDSFALHMADKKKTNFFLMWMDGGLKVDPNIIFIAATNHEDGMDPAVKRAGRLEERVEFTALDFEGVRDVMKIHMKLSEDRAGRSLFDEVEWEKIRQDLDGLTGADAMGIVKLVKKRQAQRHKEQLEPQLEKYIETEFLEDKNAVMDLVLEGQPELSPGLIDTESIKEAVSEFMDEKKRKRSNKTVVSGFSARANQST